MNNDKNYFFFFSTLFHLHQPELFVDSSEEMPNLQNKKKKIQKQKSICIHTDLELQKSQVTIQLAKEDAA